MNRKNFTIMNFACSESNAQIGDSQEIVGFICPTPCAPAFIFPVFIYNGVYVVRTGTSDLETDESEPILMDENFLRLSTPLKINKKFSTDELYALWLPSEKIIVANIHTLRIATQTIKSELSCFPNYSEELCNILGVESLDKLGSDDIGMHSTCANTFSEGKNYVEVCSDFDFKGWLNDQFVIKKQSGSFSMEISVNLSRELTALFIFSGSSSCLPKIKFKIKTHIDDFICFFKENWWAIILEKMTYKLQKYDREFKSRHFLSSSEDEFDDGVFICSDNEGVSISSNTDIKSFVTSVTDWTNVIEFVYRELIELGKREFGNNCRTDHGINRRIDKRSILKLYTSIHDDSLLNLLASSVSVDDPNRVRFDNSEILAVARMRSSNLVTADLEKIFDNIQSVSHNESNLLNELSNELLMEDVNPEICRYPFRVGRWAARWLRNKYNNTTGLVDPRELLRQWGVYVKYIKLTCRDIEAIGFWGQKHGPGILLNTVGKYSGNKKPRRATLSHEICHLLLDRGSAFPIAEVLEGRVNSKIEQRARSFAAELLLPSEVAYSRLLNSDRTIHEIGGLILELSDEYKCSKQVAAFQCKNGLTEFCLEPKEAWIDNALSYIEGFIDVHQHYQA